MPRPPLPDDLRALLEKPNPSVVATLRKDGHPVTVATWYVMDGDRVLVNMDHTRVRLKHLKRDPRVSLTVLDEAGWYTHVSLVGRVVEMKEDEGLVDIDRIAEHYTGKPYSVRDSQRFSAWIEVDRYHGWGKARGR